MSYCHPGRTVPAQRKSKDPARRLERYDRIVTAATSLATLGNDCQIRSVATAAGIAPSTVYRYFASKNELLLACLHRWLRDFADAPAATAISEAGPDQRVLTVARMLTTSLCSSPRFTEAVIRPYLYAPEPASELADSVREQLIDIFIAALGCGPQSQPQRSIAEILSDVWVMNIAAISQHRTTIDDLMRRLSAVFNSVRHEDRHQQSTIGTRQTPVASDDEDAA